jgi:hypothetical protein
MKRSRVSFALLAFAIAPLSVQAQRTYVSAQHGSDSNPCSVTSPCRTFGQAITTVTAGGEIVVLDSGGYGPLTISKAITIVSPAGVYAGISVVSGSGISITAGSSDAVTLRNLTINGVGGIHGILASSVGALHVENCEISNFVSGSFGIGLNFNTAGKLFVSDTVFRDNDRGLQATGASSLVLAQVSARNCRFENNSSGGFITFDFVSASVNDSTLTDNGAAVIEAASTSSAENVTFEHCLIANNITGVLDANSGGGTTRLSNCDVTGNGTGLWQAIPHVIETYGNNRTRGNTNANVGTITTVSTN